MSSLFDPLKLGQLTLPNRIVMAPMTRSRNDDNGVPPALVGEYYVQRASAGLIISEATYISASSKGYSRIPGLHSAEQVAGWRKVTDAIHAAGGRIFAQLVHCGRVCVPGLLPEGVEPVAPSAIAINGKNWTDLGAIDFVVPRALETSEIPGIVADFGKAAKNAIDAGFDGVELHSASGYLCHQFLDGTINQRTDQYGGSAQNRIRFVVEVIDALVAAIGADRVGIKVSPQIKFNDVKEPDAAEVYPLLAKALSDRKIAYLHGAKQGGYDVHEGMRPLFHGTYLAGAGLDQAAGEALLQSGGADAIVYGAPFISNPDLPKRFKDGIALAPGDSKTHYSKGPVGYTDYPSA